MKRVPAFEVLVHASGSAEKSNAPVLASKLETANTLVSRTKGLLGRSNLPNGQGLWIKRCNSIHTFFMRFPIDAVFVDDKLHVVSIYQNLKPWRMTWVHLKASSVFELPAGTLKTTAVKVGDRFKVETAKNAPGGSDGL